MERLEGRALLAAGAGAGPTVAWGPSALFVERVYQDLLGRPAEIAVLRAWSGALDGGRIARFRMVQMIQATPEARRAEVNDIARTFLGHPAAPANQSLLASFLASGGTLDQVRAMYLGSSEYFARNGGVNPDFVAALYRDVLGRPAEPATTSALVAALAQGASRTNMAAYLLSLPEAREDQAWADVQRLLRTDPDPSLVSSAAAALQHGQREEGLIAVLMASPAYSRADWEPAVLTDNPDVMAAPNLANGRRAQHEALKQQARAGNRDVVFLGDSITALWARPEAGGPTFQRVFAPLKAGVFGIQGDGTQNLLWRLRDGELDGLHPKVIVLLIGTNNIGWTGAEQTAGGVRAVVDELRARLPGTKILLVGILPRAAASDPPGLGDRIGLANALIAKLDDGGQTVRYLDAGAPFLRPDGSLTPGLMADGAHPSSRGYDALAATLVGPLNTLLNAGRTPAH